MDFGHNSSVKTLKTILVQYIHATTEEEEEILLNLNFKFYI